MTTRLTATFMISIGFDIGEITYTAKGVRVEPTIFKTLETSCASFTSTTHIDA